MQGIDVFLDTYVRIDEGTAVLLCSHRASVRTAAWMYAALWTRGVDPETYCFEEDGDEGDAAVTAAIRALRARPGVRRVAVIVCEPGGPSLQNALAAAQGDKPERTPIFRISGCGTGIFETGFGEAEEEAENEALGLTPTDIDDLLAQCDTEMGDLDDRDIEEVAAMTLEEDVDALSDEELAALAELEDSELLELATAWGEEGFRVLA
ncbi:hypothetical protein [Polyangium spumosum]|uniref:Uncharacterized protein n=1 Tax=Polyangium spumosum TaxID=889282 RepID=A0A6N7Q4Y7_9BACT|nr:hypothetical protein [Polyangium spumosum]MRG97745.1 hypothetical protein [Polyangium spumosum]